MAVLLLSMLILFYVEIYKVGYYRGRLDQIDWEREHFD